MCGIYFVLESNGDLYPCDFYCKEEYRLGNIADNTPFSVSVKQKTLQKNRTEFTVFAALVSTICSAVAAVSVTDMTATQKTDTARLTKSFLTTLPSV